jgi:hypothetical protein
MIEYLLLPDSFIGSQHMVEEPRVASKASKTPEGFLEAGSKHKPKVQQQQLNLSWYAS